MASGEPEAETDPRTFAGRVLAVLAGAVLLRHGYHLYATADVVGRPVVVASVFATYLTAFALVCVAVTGVDLTRWGTHLATVSYLVALPGFYFAYFVEYDAESLGTDAILFSRYSVDLLLQGKNPYAHPMSPAFDLYGIDHRFVTYQLDGSVVDSLSYPALSVLYYLPQAALGIRNLNLTTVVVMLVLLALLIRESPSYLALAPFVVLFADPNLTFFSYGGVFDVLWVLPLLLAMKFWAARRLGAAAFLVGLAFAVKQTPWFVGPFLAVWLYLESESYREFGERARTCLGYGTLGFLLPNLPFLAWNPAAWARSVFTPIAGGPGLVQQGSGFVLLSSSGSYPLPKSFFTLTLLVALVSLLVVYALYFDRLRWLAWLTPMVVLWFNYRSLQNYFVFFVPVAYYSILLQVEGSKGAGTGRGSKADGAGRKTEPDGTGGKTEADEPGGRSEWSGTGGERRDVQAE